MPDFSCLSDLVVLGVTLLWFQVSMVMAGKTLYLDTYGHCQREGRPFELEDDMYTIMSSGGDDIYGSTICEMTFRAPSNYGICLSFQELTIELCNIKVKVYSSNTASGSAWRTLTCRDPKPSKMCTSSRYVTVQISKPSASMYGYEFEIDIEKSHSVTGEGVLFASLGVFLGIVVGVVALIALLGAVLIYCCVRQRRKQDDLDQESEDAEKEMEDSSEHRAQREQLVQPSAPPVEDSHRYLHGQQYRNLEDLPPPYVPPPPYAEEAPSGSCSIDVSQEFQHKR